MARRLVALTVVAALAVPASAASKFEPPDGRTLLIIGQDRPTADAYVKATGQEPAGFMGYTGLTELEGLDASFDGGGGEQFASEILKRHPGAAFQLGLYLVNSLDDVNAGGLDSNIDRLGKWIQSTGRPVFLRIGYEFDFPENHYDPVAYKKAFRHIAQRLRSDGVTNVAFVWHSCACAPPDKIMDWYPGGDVVDWFGVSLFAQFPRSVEKVAATAQRIGKPLMIAEGSAWNARNEPLKLAWFRRVFKFVEANDVKALCYIDWNWDEIPSFSGNKWGDARVDATPAVLALWKSGTSAPRYLKAGPATLKAIRAR